jgi:uncharacterized damage-inducible protein DinB
VSDFVNAELDRRHPERVQFREAQTADGVREMWDTIERLWAQAIERAGRLPAAALAQQVNEEWSFEQTLRHLVFVTDAWASRTVLDEEMPYHPLGLPQSWYPAAAAAELGIDLTAHPSYAEILAARADRMAVMRRIVTSLTDESLGRLCQRSPAPGYPDEERTVIDCISVVMDEEIERFWTASRVWSPDESQNRVRVMSATSVPAPSAAASSRAECSSAALVMSISSGADTTGTPLTSSTGNLPSCICVTSRGRGPGCAERRCCGPYRDARAAWTGRGGQRGQRTTRIRAPPKTCQ